MVAGADLKTILGVQSNALQGVLEEALLLIVHAACLLLMTFASNCTEQIELVRWVRGNLISLHL